MRSSTFPATFCFAAAICCALCGAAVADDFGAVVAPPAQPCNTYDPSVGSQWPEGVVVVGHAGVYADGPSWQPGGYEGRVGAPYYYSAAVSSDPYSGFSYSGGSYYPYTYQGYYGSQETHADAIAEWEHEHKMALGRAVLGAPLVPGNPYAQHFGTGFYRYGEYGHVRFPYYSYRAPFYFPGHPVFSRNLNLSW